MANKKSPPVGRKPRLTEADMKEAADEVRNVLEPSPQDTQALIHELRVHQVELKTQNEELRRIQRELEEARDRYTHLYDFAPVGYLTVGEKGIIAEANLTATMLLGLERANLVGSPFSRFVHDEDQDIFYLSRRQLLDTEQPQTCRLRMKKKNNNVFLASLESIVVEGRSALPKQIRLVISDISEQKNLEDQLRQAQKLEAIGTLAGGIAHDFNNILASMIGFADLALDDARENIDLQDKLHEILAGGKRAKLLVQQILTFSHKSPQKQAPLRLDTLVQETAGLIRSILPATIRIEVGVHAEMDLWVTGNESQIHQVLMNLCTNAAQAIEPVSGQLTITLEDYVSDHSHADHYLNLPAGNYVKLSVSDTGAGMTPATLERIFEPYFSTKDPDKGSGMGLSVVSGIVEAHNGHIFVVSQVQQGTTFSVYWPRLENPPHVQLKQTPLMLPTGCERILFVDDEFAIRKLMEMVLEKLGYAVSNAADGLQALELFRAAPLRFDLVISDMTMPDMTGDQLVVELKKIRPDLPVIICTGYGKSMSEELSEQIGVNAFLGKPVNKEELARTIRKVLDDAKGSI